MKVTPDTSILQSLANATLKGRGAGDDAAAKRPSAIQPLDRNSNEQGQAAPSQTPKSVARRDRLGTLSSQQELEAAKEKTASLGRDFSRESPTGRTSTTGGQQAGALLGQIVDIRV